MELVDRYIHAVTQKLPSKAREEIGKELRGLIDDMLEEKAQGDQITNQHIEDVLLELGDPRELALKYRDDKKYFIGPTLFDPFVIVLKVTLISVFVIMGTGFIIKMILYPPEILDAFIHFILDIVTVVPMAVGWIVLTFALVEFLIPDGIKKKQVDRGDRWHPADLPEIPHPKGRIKKGEVITGIICYMILIALCSSKFLGIWLFEDGHFKAVIPFFNPNFYGYQLIFILLIFGVGIIKEALKLVFGKWTIKLVIITAVVNVLSIIGLLIFISLPDIWNPEFMKALVENGLLIEGSETYVKVNNFWNGITLFLTILFPIALIWDIVDGLIRVQRSKY